MSRYIIVGGNPFTGYTGTLSYTSLRIVGAADDEESARRMLRDADEECAGLLMCIDTETAQEAEF